MGSKGSRGPSKAEIERQAREQERKVKFESAKGEYLGRVASREIAAQTGLDRLRSSFEYEDMIKEGFVPTASLFIPERFTPALSAQVKGASSDYATVELPYYQIGGRYGVAGISETQARALESQGYKYIGQNKTKTAAIYQRGSASVTPEEQSYAWFTAANLGYSNPLKEFQLRQGNLTTDTYNYNQELYKNLMSYNTWNSTGGNLAAQERQSQVDLFKSMYGGMTQEQINKGDWKESLRSNQALGSMLFGAENYTRGSLQI